MQKIEYSLSSLEVAEMLETEHWKLLRKLEGNKKYKGIITVLTDNNFVVSDFFIPSAYKDSSGKENRCYQVTRKGCEFLANKFTGEKGVIFTARYINRFHEMQDILSKKEVKPELPWFIRRFRGEYIMLFRDFKSLTGVEICGNYTAWKRPDKLEGGRDYNGWGWYTVINKEEFLKEYGFEYGDEEKCMMYLYPHGIRKSLEIYRRESGRKLNQGAYDMIADGLKAIEPPKKEIAVNQHYGLPVRINIVGYAFPDYRSFR